MALARPARALGQGFLLLGRARPTTPLLALASSRHRHRRRVTTSVLQSMLPDIDTFARRHIGPSDEEASRMLARLEPPASTMDEFIRQVVPADVLSWPDLSSVDAAGSINAAEAGQGMSESKLAREGAELAGRNRTPTAYVAGGGYFGTHTPAVIRRNVLENPAWYTSYTPYQPEISQGRLESLLNFQTMVSDLTALPIANASLLDEGTAAAEAMTLSLGAQGAPRTRPGGGSAAAAKEKTFLVDRAVSPNTVSVLRSRAEGLGIRVRVADACAAAVAEEVEDEDLFGVLLQYPDHAGGVADHRALVEAAHGRGALVSVATDLLALTVLAPPGEWGADVAVGSAQRFGVPLGNGGPHAAFMAVREEHKRRLPGRLVGVSRDRTGRRALRLALQTREQHIRRERATSNVCTAQALLANMAALYAVYHGPAGLRAIADKVVRTAAVVEGALRGYGYHVAARGETETGDRGQFGGVRVRFPDNESRSLVLARLLSEDILPREGREEDGGAGYLHVFMDETTDDVFVARLLQIFREYAPKNGGIDVDSIVASQADAIEAIAQAAIPAALRRTSGYLTHPVFNSHHSETELLRYIHHLQSRDLSLVHSMIPLGSCTMKLNGTTEMELLSLPGFSAVGPTPVGHPALAGRSAGYQVVISELSRQLAAITGLDAVSLQPNSGAQGEFAGLRVIRKYHERRPGPRRDVCLIPVSAHGTNPASAAMAGMRVVPVRCDGATGNLDLADLESKCVRYADVLGAIMITYPSTFGVFEPRIRDVCALVHRHGGLVYMDGANMNAQIGLCSPGQVGADVCHLNLHKTFCIPHGGGGPGVGPICVRAHLAPFLPGAGPGAAHPMVASAPHGSASILTISWAYNRLMGGAGLRRATTAALLGANYLLSRLRPHYPVLYTNAHGRCAHEFILDPRPFRATAGIEAIDIAKRLQDYGFHAPTMSWPVAGTLMIEPTESESLEELDRFADALVSIRGEIGEIEAGRAPREDNVLRMAPHTLADVTADRWDRSYSREKAAWPVPWLREKKFWPSVGRIDDAYGDINLFCTCPPVEASVDDVD